MAGYNTVVNSASKNNYFTNAGVAIGSTNQPNVDDTVMAGVLDTSLGINMYGFVSESFPASYTGNDNTQIIMGVVNTLKKVGSNALREPGAVPPIATGIDQITAVRTTQTAQAIRQGLWVQNSGTMVSGGADVSPLPTYNDFSAFGNDNEADSNKGKPGLYSFNPAGSTVTRGSYPPR